MITRLHVQFTAVEQERDQIARKLAIEANPILEALFREEYQQRVEQIFGPG